MRTKFTIHELKQFLFRDIKKEHLSRAFAFHSQDDCLSGNKLDLILKSAVKLIKDKTFSLLIYDLFLHFSSSQLLKWSLNPVMTVGKFCNFGVPAQYLFLGYGGSGADMFVNQLTSPNLQG